MKKISYFLEYAFIRLVEAFFFLLPRPIALRAGEGMGLLFSKILVSRNRLAMANMSIAFPSMSEKERARLARLMWKNIGRTAVEFIRVSDITPKNFNDFFIIEGRENLDAAMKKGKGLILVTLHFSNWEMCAVGTAHLVGEGAAIARPMKNPYAEKWIQKKRADSGVPIILHRQAVRASLRILKDKKTLGVLVDQNLYTGGVFVDFFGRPAATTPLPALLNDRTEAPVLLTYCLRDGNKFRVIYEPMLKFSQDGTTEQRLLANTERISHELERVIKTHPENWFWIHNRWKRKPE
jgi:KDO2-lipid IV(A) lauroyltransferase